MGWRSSLLENGALRPHVDSVQTRLVNPFALLLALLHAYIGLRLLAPFGALAQVAGASALLACLWLLPKGFRKRESLGPIAALVPWIAMGFFSWLLVLTLGREASLLVAAVALSAQAYETWARVSAIAVMALTPAITLAGYVMARRLA